MQPQQPLVAVVLPGEAPADLDNIELHPLVVTVKPVLGNQPLMDHAGLQPRVGGQPGIDHRRPRPPPGDEARRTAQPVGQPSVGRQVLPHRAPVHTDFVGDLAPARASGAQG
jgi:hypothetical protein